MPIDINSTIFMLQAIERTFPPSNFLLDTFFPNDMPPTPNEYVQMEYRKGGRTMAPFIIDGAKGVNSRRALSSIKQYAPPLLGPSRTLTNADISKRGFGETVYSKTTPAQRAMAIRARDLAELQDMITRRMSWMAAQTLVNGKYDIVGYADDGNLAQIDTVDFTDGWTQKLTLTGTDTWDNSGAKIYNVLRDASGAIQRNAGMVPTVAIAGKNIDTYLLNNSQIRDWLMVPNAQNLSLMSLAPRIQSPNVMRIGYIQSLNLEIYQYNEVYQDVTDLDENGMPKLKPYIPDDTVILGVPGRGKQLFGAVTVVEGKDHVTYESKFVPRYLADEDANATKLKLYSRVVLCPEFIDDWYTIKVK